MNLIGGTITSQHQSTITLRGAYDQVCDIIPNYQWTTLQRGPDLIHIPTTITISQDVDGYYLTQNHGTIPLYNYEVGDFVQHTTDPRIAVAGFVIAVVQEMIQERLENK